LAAAGSVLIAADVAASGAAITSAAFCIEAEVLVGIASSVW